MIARALPDGLQLLRAFPDQGIYYLQVPPEGSRASRRRAAEMLCGVRETCQVYGWGPAVAAPPGPQIDEGSRKSALFVFQRGRRAERRVPGSLERFR